VKYDQLD